MNKMINTSFLVIATVITTMSPGPGGKADGLARPESRAVLRDGGWWITETHVLEQSMIMLSGPRWLQDHVYYHKWRVKEGGKVEGKETWLLEICAHDVPEDVTNDMKDKPLYKLYITKNPCQLVRIEADLRRRRYHVTGTTGTQYVETYNKEQPVMVDWMRRSVPLDIPAVTWPWTKTGVSVSEKADVKKYIDGRTKETIIQTVQFYTSGSRTKDMAAIVTLQRGKHLRTQHWTASCPWWSEWRRITDKGLTEGMWLSKVIDWKGKKSSGSATTKAVGARR